MHFYGKTEAQLLRSATPALIEISARGLLRLEGPRLLYTSQHAASLPAQMPWRQSGQSRVPLRPLRLPLKSMGKGWGVSHSFGRCASPNCPID